MNVASYRNALTGNGYDIIDDEKHHADDNRKSEAALADDGS